MDFHQRNKQILDLKLKNYSKKLNIVMILYIDKITAKLQTLNIDIQLLRVTPFLPKK